MRCRAERHRRGFTLIELLVVVAIIALLISILLPALSRAREQAKVATCLANLKGLTTATQAYWVEEDDGLPFYVYRGGNWLGVSSFSMFGKSSHEYWKKKWGGVFYLTADRKPLNRYLVNAEIGADDEFEMLRCPSDTTSYARIYDNPREFTPEDISSYDDLGSSYHFNFYPMTETKPSPWRQYEPGRYGWSEYFRLMLQQTRTDATLAEKLVLYSEEPHGFALRDNIQMVGNHREFSKGPVAFYDGHAEYLYLDTRYWCGRDWYAINPYWIETPEYRPPKVRYKKNSGRTCEY